MSKKTKIWLVIAATLILVGGIIFAGVMTALKWDFIKLSTVKYETNNYEINENYKNVMIVTNTADIEFVVSENLKSTVACYEQKSVKHSVTVREDALVIEVIDTRKWYEYIGIFFGSPKINISIPQGEYGVLSIKSDTGDIEIPKNFKFENIAVSTSTGDIANYSSASESIEISTDTGDICVENVLADMLDLSVSTGKVIVSDVDCKCDVKINVSTGNTNMTDVKCQNIISNGNTGDMSLKNVIAKKKYSIERSTGRVKLDGCDAAEIFIKTDTGDITGSLLTDKVFITQTDTGRIDIPKTITGGKCELITDTGDIKITVN